MSSGSKGRQIMSGPHLSSGNGQEPQPARHSIYLGLGSNLGDRDANLRAALGRLADFMEIARVSSVYETEPLLVEDQPLFHNLACAGLTSLGPLDLLHSLKRIERDLGRVPGPRYGPRQIDIDILLYSDLIVTTPELTIPHPGMLERAFVLIPLAEIAPDERHPVAGQAIGRLAARVDGSGVRLLGAL
jgi:2-amino-4-hydroxy-6-hydroxymethyldihydropteridine diphosphokinase